MSSEDLPVAISSERNGEESCDTLLTDEETENKYVIHEVVVEIMETDNDIKTEITMEDDNFAPDVPSKEIEDVKGNMVLDEESAPDIPSEEVQKVSEITMLDENSAPNITLEQVEEIYEISVQDEDSAPNMTLQQLQDGNGIKVLDQDSAPNTMLEQLKERNKIKVLDQDSAPSTALEQLKEGNEKTVVDEASAPNSKLEQFKEGYEITVLDKDAAYDIPIEEVKDVNENMMLDDICAPGTGVNTVKELQKTVIIETDSEDADDTDARIDDAIEDNELPDHLDTYPVLQRMRRVIEERVMPPMGQKANVQLFTVDSGPQLYKAKGNLVTAPIITKNLPKVFDYLPIHGKPQDSSNLKEFFSHKIREFVGCGLTDDEFQQLEDYCSPEQLKTGDEIEMETTVPVMGVIDGKFSENFEPQNIDEPPDLCILKKNKLRLERDNKGLFIKKLKYRGVRNLPFTQEMYNIPQKPTEDNPDIDLEPGKDILYRVRVYRPYVYSQIKDRYTRSRHSVFSCDIILTGRNKLSELRDRFVCHNDFDMRVDVSNHPDRLPSAKAKEVFPSGFLFINNVFYVDTREGCVDYSEPIRDWARKKELGVFPKRDMCEVRLEELTLKLGYPEVYVHQGNCEHVFLFSEIRLLNPTDPLRLHNYPCTTAIAQNQTVYCTTCAEFSAKWIVVGCSRVPFDPAFFCDTCFKQYLYIDGKKIGEFKAYSYRGNALNLLKPQ